MDKNNRRKFFEDYARDNDFDPLVASNWYSQTRNHIMAYKVRAKYKNILFLLLKSFRELFV